MKKLLFLLSFGVTCLFMQAQQTDTWKIKWNKKTLLETGQQDETANTKKISRSDLDKKYCLEITYKESDSKKEKEWKRSFMLFDDKDQELMRKDSTRIVKISAADLKKLFGDKNKIKLYTIAIPTDPEVAARVRVRRIHLLTLELQ